MISNPIIYVFLELPFVSMMIHDSMIQCASGAWWASACWNYLLELGVFFFVFWGCVNVGWLDNGPYRWSISINTNHILFEVNVGLIFLLNKSEKYGGQKRSPTSFWAISFSSLEPPIQAWTPRNLFLYKRQRTWNPITRSKQTTEMLEPVRRIVSSSHFSGFS